MPHLSPPPPQVDPGVPAVARGTATAAAGPRGRLQDGSV